MQKFRTLPRLPVEKKDDEEKSEVVGGEENFCSKDSILYHARISHRELWNVDDFIQ